MNPPKDSEKIFPASKRIAIGATSSLGDLKAELLKRKAEAAKKVRSVKVSASSSGSEKWKKEAEKLESSGKVKGVKPGKKLTQEEEESSKLDEDLRKSREALERKTRIYEQRYNRAIQEVWKNSSESEEDDSDELVNFKEKVFLDMRGGNLSAMKSSPKRDEDDEEDWVEFTDSLGRTRRCLKHDLNHYKKLDEEVAATAKFRLKPPEGGSVTNHETRGAKYESFVRQGSGEEGNGDEGNEEPKAGPIHYRDVLKDEIRDHGVAYFAFSSDDAERKKQRELLDNLRDQTKKSRVEALRLRKQQKVDRLRKVAEEQGIPFKEEDVTSSDDSDDEVGDRSESAFDSTSSRDREVEELKHTMTRDWDVGKKDDSGKTITLGPQVKSEEEKRKPRLKCSQKDYIKSRRDERQQEFAPPTFYYDVGITSNNDNNSPSLASKGFNSHPSTKRFKSAPITESSTQSVPPPSNPSGSACPDPSDSPCPGPSDSPCPGPSDSPCPGPTNDFEKIIEEKLKLFKNSSS